MMTIRFSVEFRTETPPVTIDRRRFLLVGNEVRFVDPLTLHGVAYVSDLGTVAARIGTIADAEYIRLEPDEQACFLAHMNLLNRQVDRYNKAFENSCGVIALTILLLVLTIGIFNYSSHRRVTAIAVGPRAFPAPHMTGGPGFRNGYPPVVTGNSHYNSRPQAYVPPQSGFSSSASTFTPVVTGGGNNHRPQAQVPQQRGFSSSASAFTPVVTGGGNNHRPQAQVPQQSGFPRNTGGVPPTVTGGGNNHRPQAPFPQQSGFPRNTGGVPPMVTGGGSHNQRPKAPVSSSSSSSSSRPQAPVSSQSGFRDGANLGPPRVTGDPNRN